MILFWAICASLILAALAFILFPLLRKSQADVGRDSLNVFLYQQQLAEMESDLRNGTLREEQYAQGKEEIQKRLLDDVSSDKAGTGTGSGRKLVIVSAILLPLLSVLLYLQLGNPKFLSPEQMQTAASEDMQVTPENIAKMVKKLEDKLAKSPEDAEGWSMLGKSYQFLKRNADAARAFERASTLMPNDAQMMVEYAESLILAGNNSIKGKPEELAEKALKIDPENQKALALLGSSALQAGDAAKGVAYWEKLLSLLPPNSEDAAMVAKAIEQVRAAAKASGKALPASKFKAPKTVAGATVSGTLTLRADLASKVKPDDTLFIYAKAANGPKMPLAILKIQAKEIPLTFSLDDTLAMSEQMKLSNFKEVVVGARISRSGNAMAQSGDLEGISPTVNVGAKNVAIEIDRVVP